MKSVDNEIIATDKMAAQSPPHCISGSSKVFAKRTAQGSGFKAGEDI